MTASSHTGSVPYRAYLRYAGGLEAGAPVLFGGITAGRVTAVRPGASDPTRIEILMELKKGTRVNEKYIAKLGSVSLMSGPALLISTGSNEARRIAAGDSIPSQEVASMDEIIAKVSTVADSANALMIHVQGELGGICSDARTVLANLNSLTGRPNQERLRATLEQTRWLVTDARPKIDRMTDQLSGVIAKVAPLLYHPNPPLLNVT